MGILDGLLVSLGFDYDDEEVNQFNKDVTKAISGVKKFTKIALGGALAITGIATASSKASDDQKKLSDSIGVTVEEISALQFAQKQATGSSSGMAESLKVLSKARKQLLMGEGPIKELSLLGISPQNAEGQVKSVTDLFHEISNSLQGLSKSDQQYFAEGLGLGNTLLLLQKGSKGIDDLTNRARALGVTTAEDAKLAEEFNDMMGELWQTLKFGAILISREISPALKKMADSFLDWWVANKQLVSDGLEKLIPALKIVAMLITAGLALKVLGLANAFLSLSVNMGMLKGVVAGLKTLLTGGLIVALGTAIVEADNFMKGQDTLWNDLLKKFPEYEQEILNLIAVFDVIGDTLAKTFKFWFSGHVIDDFKKAFIIAIDEVKQAFNGFWDYVTGKGKKAEEPLTPKEKSKLVTDKWARDEDKRYLQDLARAYARFTPTGGKLTPELRRRAVDRANRLQAERGERSVANTIQIDINSVDPRESGRQVVKALSGRGVQVDIVAGGGVDQ